MVLQLLTPLAATFGAYGLYQAASFFYREWSSPLRMLPGPPSPSWIYGNLKEIWDAENSVLQEKWVKEYGPTITYKGFIGTNRLWTTDLRALNHILVSTDVYQKPETARYALTRILGTGVLVVEGEQHRAQRRIMNPAFGHIQIRELTEIFVEKSIELRDCWLEEASNNGGIARVDALSWLSRMTLDVIGLAGFNYKFDALTSDPKTNELSQAFAKLFEANTRISPIPVIRGLVPALRWLPAERDGESKKARETMERIGRELLRNSKAELEQSGRMKKDSIEGKNLLTLLLRANMATDLPEHQRMSDADVLAQVPTFLVAGHETTSTATTWALYALCASPDVQAKLREELLSVSTEIPTMDELNALPYLDAVIRETLRIHPPVNVTSRVAMKDDVLSLDTPFTDRNGKVHNVLQIRKGDNLLVPIVAVNRAETIWGEDSFQFRPERWAELPEAVSGIPNVWGNTLTFLAGPRACIGYRFSLVEIKAILFTLLRAFEFELAVPIEEIGKKTRLVQRPVVKSNPKAGNQLPIIVKPIHPI